MTLIIHLHAHARYCFNIDGQEAEVGPGQGIRQGCGMAPAIWTIVSLSLVKVMQTIAPYHVLDLHELKIVSTASAPLVSPGHLVAQVSTASGKSSQPTRHPLPDSCPRRGGQSSH